MPELLNAVTRQIDSTCRYEQIHKEILSMMYIVEAIRIRQDPRVVHEVGYQILS